MYASVNATRSTQEATDCSDVENNHLSKKIELSMYFSIDIKHCCCHVKFEGGSFIPFARKKRFKK
jgi:hypothetical protein